LRLMRKADAYEWYPLSRREALCMLQQQGLQAEDVTLEAIRFAGESDASTGLPFARLVLALASPRSPHSVFRMYEEGQRRPLAARGVLSAGPPPGL
jgi:hypothetical protein